MKRYYYLTKSIDEVDKVADDLHRAGVTDWNFHVLGNNKAELSDHHISMTSPFHERDIVRCVQRGALIGITAGVFCSIAGTLFSSFIAEAGFGAQFTILCICGLFGAWTGGLSGMSTENYKIRRFHDDIEAGYYLILVDTDAQRDNVVPAVMKWHFDVVDGGEDETLITPFDQAA